MLSTRQLRSFAVVAAFCVGALASSAEAQRVSASLVATEVTVQNGIVEATFRIEVTNDESTPLSNVWLVFADGGEVLVGEVPAEGSAASGSTSRTFDVSGSPSAYVPIPVTLKYSANGAEVEKTTTVVLRTQQ